MYMKDVIREYFTSMLSNGYGLKSAKDNLLDIVVEIASEFEEEKKMKIHEIECWNGFKQFEYYVLCFERNMIMIFKDFDGFSNKELFDNLEYNYFKWCEDAECQCCEETLLDNLPKVYKDNLACVIYEETEEDEENE